MPLQQGKRKVAPASGLFAPHGQVELQQVADEQLNAGSFREAILMAGTIRGIHPLC